MKSYIINYIKSAQFGAILSSLFAWFLVFTFPIKYGDKFELNAVIIVFACIITCIIPFCSTKPTKLNLASELEKLSELKKQGLLSEEEYEKAKNKLIK